MSAKTAPALLQTHNRQDTTFGWLGKTISEADVSEYKKAVIKKYNPGNLVILYHIMRLLPWLNLYFLLFGTVQKSNKVEESGKAIGVFIFSIFIPLAFLANGVLGSFYALTAIPLFANILFVFIALTAVTKGPSGALEHAWHFTPLKGYTGVPENIQIVSEQPYDMKKASLFVLWFGPDPLLVLVERSSWKPMALRKKLYIGAWETGTWMDTA